MSRLEKREVERYSDLLLNDPVIKENSKAFLCWAERYDDDNFKGRSKQIHLSWMKLLNYTVLRLDGVVELNEQVNRVLNEIKQVQVRG